jgi:hypothetical protein
VRALTCDLRPRYKRRPRGATGADSFDLDLRAAVSCSARTVRLSRWGFAIYWIGYRNSSTWPSS